MSIVINVAKNMSVTNGTDGTWLNFATNNGKHASINITSTMNRDYANVIQQWAEDRFSERTPMQKRLDTMEESIRRIDEGITKFIDKGYIK